MPIVRFFGDVLPNYGDITLGRPPVFTNYVPEHNLTARLQVNIASSKVEVICELSVFHIDHLAHLWFKASEAARVPIDLFCFATGTALSVRLHTFQNDMGLQKPLEMMAPDLSAICTVYDVEEVVKATQVSQFEQVMKLLLDEPDLQHAVSDLVQSLGEPLLASINCGRALDGLRNAATKEMDPKKGWPIFREIVRADEKYLSLITEDSKKPRHGVRTMIPSLETKEAMRRTWEITNRFLHYRKRGNAPLDLTVFPLLAG